MQRAMADPIMDIPVGKTLAQRLLRVYPGMTPEAAMRLHLNRTLTDGARPAAQAGAKQQQILPEAMEQLEFYRKFAKTLVCDRNIPKATQVTQHHTVGVLSMLTSITATFPAGTKGLVHLKVHLLGEAGTGETRILPTEYDDREAIALDDGQIRVATLYLVEPGQLYEVTWSNYDGVYAHVVPVVATLIPYSVFLSPRGG